MLIFSSKGTKTSDVIKAVVLIFASIGCIFQINTITSKYFQYTVTALVRIDMATKVEIPDITILYTTALSINYTKIVEMIPEAESYFPLNPITDRSDFLAFCLTLEGFLFLTLMLKDFRLNDLNKARWQGKDIFQLKYIADPDDKNVVLFDVKAEQFCKLHDFVAADFFGTTMICERDGLPLLYNVHDILVGACKGYVLMLEFRSEAIEDVQSLLFAVGPSNKYHFSLQQPKISLDFHKGSQTYIISFKKVENRLLPAPYTTDCIDYTKQGFKSRLHMISECENNVSLALTQAPLFENSYYFNESEEKYTGYKQRYVEFFEFNDEVRLEAQKKFDNTRRKCRELAMKPDCIQNFFSPSSFETIKSAQNQLLLALPDFPDIIAEFYPKMLLIDYFVYLGSTLGIWFGFSVSLTSIEMINFLEHQIKTWIQIIQSKWRKEKDNNKIRSHNSTNIYVLSNNHLFNKPKKIKPYRNLTLIRHY